MVTEAVGPAVTPAAEGGPHLAQAPAPQSPPGPSLDHPAPTPAAGLAPTPDPGQPTHIFHIYTKHSVVLLPP